ncbi:MAG: hypothetical protein ABS96_03360 [Lysobacteraceae bacterium SCN 69-123]|nr:MAG: hypothetical protein ABS96_03360 [Xanthomonadaceae bacterium SCN 69-123]
MSEIADFLTRFRPGGPWLLTAIVPDGDTFTKTFDNVDEAETWALDENAAGRNIYFSVNPTAHALRKKAKKSHIARVEYLHVDLDPYAGEDFNAERERIRKRLNGSLAADGIPPPSFIIDSGGGYQAFWRLVAPIELDGDPAKVEDAERYNIELARKLGGDATHDVSRIMRLPGTWNIPNATKRAKGRVKAPAKLYDWTTGEPYPLASFKQAPAARADAPAIRKTPSATQKPGPVPAGPYGVAELEAWATANGKQLPGAALKALVHGEQLTDDNGQRIYRSGSEATWAVCCGLARAGVPDELIAAAILDKNNGGAAHVHRQQKPTAYAWMQVRKARAEIEAEADAADNDTILDEMNRLHAVVVQGKVRVLSWVRVEPDDEHSDLAGRLVVDLQSFEDFRNRYRNKTVVVGLSDNGKPKLMKRGDWWLDHEHRREIRGLVFRPGGDAEINGFQNLWRGWAIEPKPGDWSKMREHVRGVLANGNDENADYILRWTAWAVQNPARQAEVALVFRGGRGVGKGIFARAVKDLFGQHGLHIRSSKHLTGDFNLHLRDCCLMFADEAIAPGDKAAESRLKGLVTEPQLLIEGKGENAVMSPNYLHIVMASNEKWVVPAGDDERRFAVFDVSGARQGDQVYWNALVAELDGGGLAAMLFDLLAMDLGDWHPRRSVPQTDALMRQKVASLTGLDAYLYDLLCVGDFPEVESLQQKGRFVSTDSLRTAASVWLRSRHGEQHVSGNDVSELMAMLGATKYRRGGGGGRGFLLPSLAAMRAKWDAVKFPADWPVDADADDTPEQIQLADGKPPF